MIPTLHYNYILFKLRTFFQQEKGFVEVPAHSRPSIIAACEDPKTISTFHLGGFLYPLAQTGQGLLDIELLKNPELKGVFCIGPSYHDEPIVIEGKHQRVFPLFDFESHGSMETLKQLESELLAYLNFNIPQIISYEEVCLNYNTKFIEAAHEKILHQEMGPAIAIEQFPLRSNPFWNIKQNEHGFFNKVSILLHGKETITAAERSTDYKQMRDNFFNMLDGAYAESLIEHFGKDRILKELHDYLSLPMVPRFCGSVSITRLAQAMQEANLINNPQAIAPIKNTYEQPSL